MTDACRRALRATALLLSLLGGAGCQREAASPAAPAAADAAAEDVETVEPVARISAAASARVGIVTAVAGPATLRERLPLYGTVRPNAERVREVVARFPGYVKTVSKAVGDPVSRGEVLATIESNESLQTYPVLAPMSGTVTAREADPGEQAGSEVLFSITDLSTVWIELSLFPADVVRVRRGQRVEIASVDGRLRGSGEIELVGALGQSASQTLTARVTLANRERQWTPGLFVNGTVELGRDPVPVAVAASALQRLDGVDTVFVPVAGGYAARRVRTGRVDDEGIEIVDGLQAGETYVAAGSFVIKAELGKAGLAEDDDDPDAAADDDGPGARL